MRKQCFVAIGRIPGECIFVHQEDVPLLEKYGYSAKVYCIGIDFLTGKHSEPAIIDVLLKFVPHEIICSEGEREVISDLVNELFADKHIKKLNKLFENIKYQEKNDKSFKLKQLNNINFKNISNCFNSRY